MITYINSTNANKYSSLFSEAEEILANYWKSIKVDPEDENRFGKKVDGVYPHGINSLNTYFSWIKDLVDMGTGTLEIDRGEKDADDNLILSKVDYDGMKFTILPLDEDVFTIDANTRRITVPTSFANNGISVQSDEISEVIYFKVDRFYDATDLYMQDIMIEWKAPNGFSGYSVPTIKILDETANYVVFGWALSSKITSKAGNITFAVRFYQYDQELSKIKYSLSTLTQTAKIMPNIDLDVAKLLEGSTVPNYIAIKDSANAITERLQNSSTGNSGDKAVEPETKDEFFSVDPTNTYAPYVVILQLADGSYAAHVTGTGYSSDAGTISYVWKKYTYDKGDRVQIKGSKNPLSFSDAYTKFSLVDAKKMHKATPELMFYTYQGIDQDVPSYKVIADIDALTEDTTPEVYRKDTKCTFDGVGYYILAIQNRKGSSTTTHNTDPFIVYPPCVPTMDEKNGGTAFLDGKDEEKNIEVRYSVNNKPDKDPAFVALTNDYTKYGYKDTNDANAVPSAKYAFDPTEEKVTFAWYCKKLGESESTPIAADADTATLTPQDEGDYFCRLAGQLNGETSDPIDSKVWHVTYLPAHATYSVAGKAPADNGDISIQTNKNLVFKDEVASDKSISAYTLYVTGNNDAKMELRYNLASMQASSDGTDRGHQLTDSIEIQRYCYELQRDAEGHTTGVPDREDAIHAQIGEYKPSNRTTALWPADHAEGEAHVFSIEDLKAINADSNGFVKLEEVAPEKDGYYFWMIKNTYNGKELTVSTPLIYFDNPQD